MHGAFLANRDRVRVSALLTTFCRWAGCKNQEFAGHTSAACTDQGRPCTTQCRLGHSEANSLLFSARACKLGCAPPNHLDGHLSVAGCARQPAGGRLRVRSCPTDNVYGRPAARAPVARAPAATPPCSCVCRESGERPRTRQQGCRPRLPPECVGRVGGGRVRRLLADALGRAGRSCRRRVRRAHAWEVQDGGGVLPIASVVATRARVCPSLPVVLLWPLPTEGRPARIVVAGARPLVAVPLHHHRCPSPAVSLPPSGPRGRRRTVPPTGTAAPLCWPPR